MVSHLKTASKRTIIWFVIFCIFGLLPYANIIGQWLVLFSPHSSTLLLINLTGSVFAALVLASALALVTKHSSFMLGFSFGLILILQVLVVTQAHPLFSKLWWFNIAEYSTFILTCGIITRYFWQVFHVKNT